jgi:hypothetical protein
MRRSRKWRLESAGFSVFSDGMNRLLSLNVVLLFLGLLGFSGCAGLGSGDTEKLLSAAGFRVRVPTTPQQIEMFNSLQPYKVERRVVGNKVIYTYADPKRNLLFIGGEKEYQQFARLGIQQQIAMSNLAAAEINQSTAMTMNMDAWGPWGIWW